MYNAKSFNQHLTNLNVTNVTIMDSMFQNAKSFNQSLNDWNMILLQTGIKYNNNNNNNIFIL